MAKFGARKPNRAAMDSLTFDFVGSNYLILITLLAYMVHAVNAIGCSPGDRCSSVSAVY